MAREGSLAAAAPQQESVAALVMIASLIAHHGEYSMAKEKKARHKQKLTAEQRRAQRNANEKARDQFAALGRFIQTFENIVDTLRWHSQRILLGEHLGVSKPEQKAMVPWFAITSLIFHHEAMTARNMMDIWRSLLAEKSKALGYLGLLSKDGQEVVDGVSKEIASEFGDICQQRNKIIHATWYIGKLPDISAMPEFMARKYAAGSDGLFEREDLPKNFDELIKLGDRCSELHNKLGRFIQYYHYKYTEIEKHYNYSRNGQKWRRWKFITPVSA